jgi:predicted nucleotidyltransferase
MSKFSFKYFDSNELPLLFATLKSVFDHAQIPFYLIGARARDVWFLPHKNIRITHDIDWIAFTKEDELFENIKNELIKNQRFLSTKNPFTLISPQGTTVDILPFSQQTANELLGLEEVFERGTEWVTFDDNNKYQIATLPAIVLLKLIAWNDCPEYRLKDLWDIEIIIDSYFDLFADDIYDNHSDLFENADLYHISAHVIGRKIKDIVGNSYILKNRIIKILTIQRETVTIRMAQFAQKTEAEISTMLHHILQGFSG